MAAPKITPGGSANKVVDRPSEAVAGLRNELDRFKVDMEHQVADVRSNVEIDHSKFEAIFNKLSEHSQVIDGMKKDIEKLRKSK